MSYQIELRQLRYFLAVAESLHFKKAADQLFLSQPAISKQIAQLEDAIGIKLFERHSRKVELTGAGQFLQAEFTGLMASLEQSITTARARQAGQEGNLRFGYVGSAMHGVIPRLLVAIRKQFPGILFDLREMDNQQQIEALLNREIDFGFVRQEVVPKNIEMYPVFTDTFSLVIPENYPIQPADFRDLAQFRDAPFVLFDPSYSKSYYQQIMQIFADSGFDPVIAHKTVQANTIYNLVECNFGVSIVPTSLKKGYQFAVHFIELEHSKHQTTLQMAWRKESRNAIIPNVLNLIPEVFGSGGA